MNDITAPETAGTLDMPAAAPANMTIRYTTNGQSYPITIAQSTTIEQFITMLSTRAADLVGNRNIRTITRAGVWTAQSIDYSAGNVPPSTVLQDGDIITASSKIDAGN